MLYWIFKFAAFLPAIKVICRPWVEGRENIPEQGPAILVSNHISAGDTFMLPAMIRRRLTFPAKAELFAGGGVKESVVKWFLRSIGMVPMDRSGGRASAAGMDSVRQILADGDLLGIFPEGTRSPDGRLYKGKTGVARLVLAAGVPVIPVAMVNTEFVRNRFGIPYMKRPGLRIGPPLDFSAWSSQNGNRDVLRWVTDEIMNAVMELSGQEYVDAYGASVKSAAAEGRELAQPVLPRPGYGRPRPPMPPEAQGIELEAS